MTVTDELRNHLDADAAQWDLGGLSALDDITTAGRRRQRTRRAVPVVAMALFATLTMAGIALMSSSEPDDAYLGDIWARNGTFPAQVAVADNGYIGLAYRSLGDAQWGGVLLESSDGESWVEAADLSEVVFAAHRQEFRHHLVYTGGQVHIFSVDESATPSAMVVQLSSSDLSDWTLTKRQLVPADGFGRPSIQDVVIGADTILISASVYPDDPPLGTQRQNEVFIAQRENDFRPIGGVAAAQLNRSSQIFPELFSDGLVVGITGTEAHEYQDGAWRILDGPLGVPSMTAARGAQRLILAKYVRADRARDSQIPGMRFFDGAEWESVNFLSALEQSEIERLWLKSVHSGAGGWAIVANHGDNRYLRFRPTDTDGPFDRDPRGEPIEMVNEDGWTFVGHNEWGPAVLRNPDGEAVQRWDLFPMKTNFEGWRTSTDHVVLVDDEGENLAAFDLSMWLESTHPTERRHQVLWSENGRDWASVHQGNRDIVDVLVAEDHLVLVSQGTNDLTERIELPADG